MQKQFRLRGSTNHVHMPSRRIGIDAPTSDSIHAAGAMAHGDDLPLPADHRVGVEVRFEAPVRHVPAGAAQPLARLAVEIENRTAAMVMNLLTEIEQLVHYARRDPPLLQAGAGMSADCEHDFHPLRTCDRNQLKRPGAHPMRPEISNGRKFRKALRQPGKASASPCPQVWYRIPPGPRKFCRLLMGGDDSKAKLLAHHGAGLIQTRGRECLPQPEFLAWHRAEVFEEPARE